MVVLVRPLETWLDDQFQSRVVHGIHLPSHHEHLKCTNGTTQNWCALPRHHLLHHMRRLLVKSWVGYPMQSICDWHWEQIWHPSKCPKVQARSCTWQYRCCWEALRNNRWPDRFSMGQFQRKISTYWAQLTESPEHEEHRVPSGLYIS